MKSAHTKSSPFKAWLKLSTAGLMLTALSACATFSGADTDAAPMAAAPAVAPAPAPVPVNPVWPELKDAGLIDADVEAKIDALMAQMTIEEKVGQTVQADIASIKPEDLKKYPLGSILAGGSSSPNGNERATPQEWLDLADAYWRSSLEYPSKAKIPLLFGIDAVHGHSNLVGAIIFPHNVGLGATRNPDLMKKIAEVTAYEMALAGVDWTFAPTVAVSRDKRWGRAYESYSENPADVAAYAGKVVEGLQGDKGGDEGIKLGRIMSSAKHYLGDGGTLGGKDQGDAVISEEELAKIHNAGYPPSIEAGVLSVMASFSSWNGEKLTGSKYLLTDVLKGRMGFDGFVVSDWNAQGQVPGCTNLSCPQAFNAGIDMFMAPDSWKGIYENTLAQAKSGEISQARLDDAVRRILRAKIKGGLFEFGAPKDRAITGKWENLSRPEHRAVARQAVRESLVLLKNNGSLLPIKGKANILVAGDGADNIGKQSGGWTISWQGTGNTNADFPHGQSIFGGIKDAATAAGGKATLSVDGSFKGKKPDVAIVVIGEDPYAEFQGDRPNLDYQPGEPKDLELIKKLKAAGIPVVTVFLSGRPMWVNPELNASNAFVAAWLPGTEGAGVADLIIGDAAGKARHDFKGRLSFSWPKTAMQQPLNVGMAGYDPLFAYGFGLTYADKGDLAPLSEVSGLSDADVVNVDNYFTAGRVRAPWKFAIADLSGAVEGEGNLKSPKGIASQTIVDAGAQEAGRRLVFNGQGLGAALFQGPLVDLSRQTTGELALSITYKMDKAAEGPVTIGVGRDPFIMGRVDVSKALAPTGGQFKTLKIKLGCFRDAGADMKQIGVPFAISSEKALDLTYTSVKLMAVEGDGNCP
jgi:beta-glucosidase